MLRTLSAGLSAGTSWPVKDGAELVQRIVSAQPMSAADLGAETAAALDSAGIEAYRFPEGSNVIDPDSSVFFLRPAMARLCAEVLQRKGRSLLLGTPGIGKSMVLQFLLKRCLEMRVPVVLERRLEKLIWVFSPPSGTSDWRVTDVSHINVPSAANLPLLRNTSCL